MKYVAHAKKLENGEWDVQTLEDHLRQSAELAAKFAADFNSAEWGYALAMIHDSGKGTAEWQEYFRDKSGFYDDEASSETIPGKLEHSGTGAKLAEEIFGKGAGRFLAYCVAGHHAGLPNQNGDQSSLAYRSEKAKTEKVAKEFKDMFLGLCPNTPPWSFKREGLDVSLWIRMLFSCLVDADRLDTERFMEPEKSKLREGYLSIAELHKRFNVYMDGKTKKSDETSISVYDARQRVLADCRSAAEIEPGFFSLTVPTGGGKTLSSMAFALKHAEKYEKKRVIYAIPYTSIIEQNAKVFRDIFGDDQIVEHHANLIDSDTTKRTRLATENWDAPIIITTNVQFFESLLSSKTSRCRKLHNIANSVVVLDEAQMIPLESLEPILETMRLLVEHYRVTFVICTATQPVFEKPDNFPKFPGFAKGSIREIIKDVDGLYRNLERVKIELPKDDLPISDWKTLADELSQHDQALCIVSDRKSCRELHARAPKGAYHLSALMCAEHRSDVIKEIKGKLENRQKILVISTQLIEAGVDIDFPVVYRAMAGLDSIAQAAGRCNRRGKLNEDGKLGRVVVFNAMRKAPVGTLRKASETALNMIKRGLDNPMSRDVFSSYFAELYWKSNSLDANGVMKLLKPDASDLAIQFRSASEAFKIIDDSAQQTILVRYGKGGDLIEQLKASKNSSKGYETKLLRELQRYSINIYLTQFEALNRRGSLEEIIPGVFALNNKVEYDACVGLLIDEIPNDPKAFIVEKEMR